VRERDSGLLIIGSGCRLKGKKPEKKINPKSFSTLAALQKSKSPDDIPD